MKKIIVCIMSILIITASMIGCTSQRVEKEPPKIVITIGDKEIKYVNDKMTWDGQMYERKENTFIAILKEGSLDDIPYIEIGKSVNISFENYPPTKLTISDILIDDKGEQICNDGAITNIPVKIKDGKCSFEIKKSFASALSSKYIENKIDIRGFRMIASWGDKNECEYTFIIKTKGF